MAVEYADLGRKLTNAFPNLYEFRGRDLHNNLFVMKITIFIIFGGVL